MSALAKLEQVLPPALRRRVNAVQSYTVAVPGEDGPTVDADALALIAVRLPHARRHRGAARGRADPAGDVEAPVVPRRLGRHAPGPAHLPRRPDDAQAADRPTVTPRDIGDDELAEYVQRGVSIAGWRYRARIKVHAPAAG